jgi:hypothetical protein
VFRALNAGETYMQSGLKMIHLKHLHGQKKQGQGPMPRIRNMMTHASTICHVGKQTVPKDLAEGGEVV